MNRRTFLQGLAAVVGGVATYNLAERFLHLELPGAEPLQIADPEPAREIEAGNWLFWAGETYPIEGAQMSLRYKPEPVIQSDSDVVSIPGIDFAELSIYLSRNHGGEYPLLPTRSDTCAVYTENGYIGGAMLVFGVPDSLKQYNEGCADILFYPWEHELFFRRYDTREIAHKLIFEHLGELEATI